MEKVWHWKQANGSILKVISNKDKGYIKVLNEKGMVVFERENLSHQQLKIVEEAFLSVVTKNDKTINYNNNPMFS